MGHASSKSLNSDTAKLLLINANINKLDYCIDIINAGEGVTEIDLSNCGIDNDGAIRLASALKNNTTLRNLNLQNNYITSAGAKALDAALEHNQTLQNLSLDEGPIRHLLYKGEITKVLDIEGMYAYQSIGEALKRNKELEEKNKKELAENISVLDTLYTLKAKITSSASLPEAIVDIIISYDDREKKGEEAKQILVRQGIYNMHYNENNLPKDRVIDLDLFLHQPTKKVVMHLSESKADQTKANSPSSSPSDANASAIMKNLGNEKS